MTPGPPLRPRSPIGCAGRCSAGPARFAACGRSSSTGGGGWPRPRRWRCCRRPCSRCARRSCRCGWARRCSAFRTSWPACARWRCDGARVRWRSAARRSGSGWGPRRSRAPAIPPCARSCCCSPSRSAGRLVSAARRRPWAALALLAAIVPGVVAAWTAPRLTVVVLAHLHGLGALLYFGINARRRRLPVWPLFAGVAAVTIAGVGGLLDAAMAAKLYAPRNAGGSIVAEAITGGVAAPDRRRLPPRPVPLCLRPVAALRGLAAPPARRRARIAHAQAVSPRARRPEGRLRPPHHAVARADGWPRSCCCCVGGGRAREAYFALSYFHVGLEGAALAQLVFGGSAALSHAARAPAVRFRGPPSAAPRGRRGGDMSRFASPALVARAWSLQQPPDGALPPEPGRHRRQSRAPRRSPAPPPPCLAAPARGHRPRPRRAPTPRRRWRLALHRRRAVAAAAARAALPVAQRPSPRRSRARGSSGRAWGSTCSRSARCR